MHVDLGLESWRSERHLGYWRCSRGRRQERCKVGYLLRCKRANSCVFVDLQTSTDSVSSCVPNTEKSTQSKLSKPSQKAQMNPNHTDSCYFLIWEVNTENKDHFDDLVVVVVVVLQKPTHVALTETRSFAIDTTLVL